MSRHVRTVMEWIASGGRAEPKRERDARRERERDSGKERKSYEHQKGERERDSRRECRPMESV